MKFLLCFSVLFVVSACSNSSIPEYTGSSEQGVFCCNKISEINFSKLQTQTPINLKISDNSPKHDFGAGDSHFIGLEIADTSSRTLTIRSWFNGTFVGPYFDPLAIFLDSSFKPISTDSLDMRYRPYNRVAFGPNKLNAHMFTRAYIPKGARYVVLTTIPSDMDVPLKLESIQYPRLRISNEQLEPKIPGRYEKLKPKPLGSLEIWI